MSNRPLGNGVQAPIGDGDVVVIGGYTLQVIEHRERQAPPAPPASPLPPDFDFEFGPSTTTPSVDELFDLKPSTDSDRFDLNPSLEPVTPAYPDARRPQRDYVPEINVPFPLPKPKPDSAAEKSMLPVAPSATDEELLRAFLAGAGVPAVQIPGGLTPQLMQVFGELLRTATQGTLELLVARALNKREVDVPVTMIAAQDNNPLKFSPTVEVAMQHLLAPQGKGFMSPPRAMKDAYDDLRAHQFGVVAGTRAALAGVLARFDPPELEKRLTQRSVIDTLLPMNRKAALWELFIKLYADIAREAEEDFHTLFGREFRKAYEAQIANLGEQNKPGK